MMFLWQTELFGTKEMTAVSHRDIMGELTSFVLEEAQQRVLTEVQEAGEEQQQAGRSGGSGVHPEWRCFTAQKIQAQQQKEMRGSEKNRVTKAGGVCLIVHIPRAQEEMTNTSSSFSNFFIFAIFFEPVNTRVLKPTYKYMRTTHLDVNHWNLLSCL